MIIATFTRIYWRDILELKIEAGAANLLVECAQLKSGDRLLLVHEEPGRGYYDDQLIGVIEQQAERLGIDVELLECPFDPWATVVPAAVKDKMRSDVTTLFLARIGDQLRFSDLGSQGKAIVSYALDLQMLGCGFGVGNFNAFADLKRAIDEVLSTAEEIRLTCPNGTACTGRLEHPTTQREDVNILRFPMLTFTPVSAAAFSGKVALPGFLVGTGSIYYRPYAVELPGALFARFENGRLTKFEGDEKSVEMANDHYDFVSKKFGIDRNYVHSWHAGIHPGCRFQNPASEDYERWSGSAFGNPRLLHFHTCGAYAPGEICWNVVDPTLSADGVDIWKAGVLDVAAIPGGEAILSKHEDVARLFRFPETMIGI